MPQVVSQTPQGGVVPGAVLILGGQKVNQAGFRKVMIGAQPPARGVRREKQADLLRVGVRKESEPGENHRNPRPRHLIVDGGKDWAGPVVRR